MLREFERIPQAEEEHLIVVLLLVHDGVVLHSAGRRERRQ